MDRERLVPVILAISIGIFSFFSMLSVSQAAEKKPMSQDVQILTKQKKGSIVAAVDEDAKVIFKNWEIHFYSTQQKNNFKVSVDGENIAQGSFEGFHYEATAKVGKGHISLIKVRFNRKTYTWNDLNTMDKTVDEEKLKEATGPKEIVMSAASWLWARLEYTVVGILVAFVGYFLSKEIVRRKKEDYILGGL